jgi:hypothetical protein
VRRALLPLLLVVACGARTGLGGFVEGTTDAGGQDVVDAEPSDVALDVAQDVEPDVPPVHCTSDAECNDGISCTRDRCERATGTCVHDPDNALCPPGFVCRPPCVAASFAESNAFLYGVALPAGDVVVIGATRVALEDIALDSHGTLYGVSGTSLYTVDTKTGAASRVAPLSVVLSALDFAPDGTLYAAGGDSLFTIDPKTGELQKVATYPPGYFSSGDLAVIGSRLLATVNSEAGENDSLLSIDLETFDETLVGSTGFRKIYGLAAYGTQLFGYTNAGQVLQIDPTTAESTVLASPGTMFYGASAR